MLPLVGAMLGGGASGILGGAGGGGLMGSLMGGMMQNGGLGGLFNNLSSLFGGGQQSGGPGAAGGDQQTNQLLGDVKDMLSQLLDEKGASGNGGDSGGASSGYSAGGGHGADGPGCGDSGPSCGGADEAGWDGMDKSPSLDRERGAARLLDQAKNTDDPGEKRELIDMAMDMLGDGPKKNDGWLGEAIGGLNEKKDGNSYDNDIVKQADKMLEQIDDGDMSDCNECKALDSVIDLLMEEGGVDGKPASNDTNGNGWSARGEGSYDHPIAFGHQSLHGALFDDRH